MFSYFQDMQKCVQKNNAGAELKIKQRNIRVAVSLKKL